MGMPQKYLFDVSFDQPEPPNAAAPARVPPAPLFSEAEIEAARSEGFAAGHGTALVEAAQQAEARVAEALERLADGAAALVDAHAKFAAETERKAVAVLRAVVQKAVPTLCRKDPLAELEAITGRCLAEALDEPRIVLRVNDAQFDAVQARLAGLAQANGYAGKIVLLADAAMSDGDARIEWADGGAERDTARLLSEIDAVLARPLDAAETATTPTQENLHE
jgi:flagellar assembly protein FliH